MIGQTTAPDTLPPQAVLRQNFTLSFASAQPGLDVFNLWAPSSATAAVPEEIGEIWRAELPADPSEAARLLEQRDQQVRLTQRAIPLAQQSLDRDLGRLTGSAPSLSFSIEGEVTGAGGILTAGWLYQAKAKGLAPDVSFGILDGIKIDPFQLEQTAQTVNRFSEQVQRTLDRLALVETVSGGRRAAITRAGWSGDLQTWWTAGAGPDQRIQHQQVLAQALATRQGWLRFLSLVAAGITRVAATLAAGPFSLISIWTTWNYLQEIVKEVQALKTRPSAPAKTPDG